MYLIFENAMLYCSRLYICLYSETEDQDDKYKSIICCLSKIVQILKWHRKLKPCTVIFSHALLMNKVSLAFTWIIRAVFDKDELYFFDQRQ